MRIKKMLNQFAVYWPKGPPARDGKTPTFLGPVEIRCRWEDTQAEVKDETRTNGVWSSKSIVDTEYAVRKGGYLWRGRYSELTDADDPRKNEDASRVEYVDYIPSVKADQALYTAYL